MKFIKTIILMLMAGFVGYIIYLAVQSSKDDTYTTVCCEFRDIESKLIIPGII